ncbi:MAG TPA: BON domain-containing protein [Bryobacteraceae bacterium]|nr:BON domain-containing protein [Bryobacteraceae bacterium]
MRPTTLLAAIALAAGLSAAPAHQADNTKMNQGTTPNADQAKNDKADVRLMARIRRAVEKDKGLSIDAHNVKIMARNGQITLSGPVKSDAEKVAVEQKATAIAGAGNVTDNLTVQNQ